MCGIFLLYGPSIKIYHLVFILLFKRSVGRVKELSKPCLHKHEYDDKMDQGSSGNSWERVH